MIFFNNNISVCHFHYNLVVYNSVFTGADPFGFPTLVRPWEDGTDSMENAKRRMTVAFDFMSKLGVKVRSFIDKKVKQESKI